VLRYLKLFLGKKRRGIYLLGFCLVILREERIPRIARESLIEIAVVANERRDIKVVSVFWGLVVR
jgi:hypothetical protein